MNARPNVTRLAWFSSLIIALLGLGAWILYRPIPNLYVSPPLDAQGRRAKIYVPCGWKLDTSDSHLPVGILKPGERVTSVFESQESILSRWLRWLGRRPAQPPSRLYLDIGRKLELLGLDPENPADGKESLGGSPPFTPTYLSYRVVKAGQPPIYGVVAFGSEDKRTFESAHTSINSFRIE